VNSPTRKIREEVSITRSPGFMDLSEGREKDEANTAVESVVKVEELLHRLYPTGP
jgi:hypothetical protein